MLPGYVSGFYSYDDCHIDLARLAAFAKARLIHAEANGIDTQVCFVCVGIAEGK
jgi:selenide,water dikinase